MRNPQRVSVLSGQMTARRIRHWLRVIGAVAVAFVLLDAPAPASAHVHVFVGGAFGFPVYAYPYYPYYPYQPYQPYQPYYPPPIPYPYVAYPAPPPPGWAPGRWEWRHDPWGSPYRVWVPAHLR
jgi:hypothetical protein